MFNHLNLSYICAKYNQAGPFAEVLDGRRAPHVVEGALQELAEGDAPVLASSSIPSILPSSALAARRRTYIPRVPWCSIGRCGIHLGAFLGLRWPIETICTWRSRKPLVCRVAPARTILRSIVSRSCLRWAWRWSRTGKARVLDARAAGVAVRRFRAGVPSVVPCRALLDQPSGLGARSSRPASSTARRGGAAA